MAQCPDDMSSRLHVLFSMMDVISSCIAFSQHEFLSVSAKEFGSSALMACSSATSASENKSLGFDFAKKTRCLCFSFNLTI